MDFGSFGAGFGSFGSALGATPLRELNPYAVYAATDVMRSGQPIVQVRRISDNATQDMTESELYGSTYDTFISGTYGHISKIYNQVSGADSATDLIQETATLQPQRGIGGDNTKCFNFNADHLYSGDISTLSDRPDFDGNISLATTYAVRSTSPQIYPTPLITYYSGSSGGFSIPYVPVHSAEHRQLTVMRHGSTPPTETVRADDYGTSQKTAAISLVPASTTMKSAYSVHSSATSRRVLVDGGSVADNSDDCGTISEPAITRFGIGGFNAGGYNKGMTPDVLISCSCIFDRGLSLADQGAIMGILNGLEV